MNHNSLMAVSTDGHAQIIASSVYMLAQTLARARDGDYHITRSSNARNRINGETASIRWGLGVVTTFADGRVVKIREYGPSFAIKRWIVVDIPHNP